MKPITVRGDIKKKSRQNISNGGGGNEPRREPIVNNDEFDFSPNLELPEVDGIDVPHPPEVPTDMVLDNPDPIKQIRGLMPKQEVEKSVTFLNQFVKGVYRGGF